MTQNSGSGIPLEDFTALLKCAFDAGAKYRKTSQEAYDYPLNHPKYGPNFKKIAKMWPHMDCLWALDCAHKVGQKAAVKAGSDAISLLNMKQACDDMELVAQETQRGPVCPE